jgi:hypothetical protein
MHIVYQGGSSQGFLFGMWRCPENVIFGWSDSERGSIALQWGMITVEMYGSNELRVSVNKVTFFC